MSDDNPMGVMVHDEVQLLDYGESRTAGPYIKLRLNDPELLAVFRGLDVATSVKPGHILHVTVCQRDPAEVMHEQGDEPDTPQKRPYGLQARELKLSSFFRTPSVWREIGDDADFLKWCRGQPCAKCKAVPPSEAAHVRRVANGAGTGIKPQYSAIALCHTCHAEQHQHGEHDREWYDAKRIEFLQAWGWERLKHTLDYESWSQVPPVKLYDWAAQRGIANYLPGVYF